MSPDGRKLADSQYFAYSMLQVVGNRPETDSNAVV